MSRNATAGAMILLAALLGCQGPPHGEPVGLVRQEAPRATLRVEVWSYSRADEGATPGGPLVTVEADASGGVGAQATEGASGGSSRWWLLGLGALGLAAGGWYVMRRG